MSIFFSVSLFYKIFYIFQNIMLTIVLFWTEDCQDEFRSIFDLYKKPALIARAFYRLGLAQALFPGVGNLRSSILRTRLALRHLPGTEQT
jgi:hypothetical protein